MLYYFLSTDVHVESPLGPAVATHSALKTATPEAEMKSDGALLATRSLFELQSLTNHTGSLEELQADVIQELPNRLETLCGSYSVNCSAVDDRFRTMNGSCNNLLHPSWGSGIAVCLLARMHVCLFVCVCVCLCVFACLSVCLSVCL